MKLPRFSRNAINKRRSQRGDFLIESLIGVLLIGIVGVGIAQTAKRVSKTQSLSQEQAIAISNLEGLAKGGKQADACNDPTVAGALKGFQVNTANSAACQTAVPFQLQLNGVTVEITPPAILQASKTYGDGDDAK
ncbi:MAG TPA: type II secretion system protein, partial [Marinagarivorans sp.]